MKKLTSLILALMLTFALSAPAFAEGADLPFTDVKAKSWYAPSVRYVYERGMMSGTDATSFSPTTPLTRAQLITILWRMAGEPAVQGEMPYTDVKSGVWYAEAVRWAAAEKVMGGGGTFKPNRTVSREEASILMWNYAQYAGADVSVDADANSLSYPDASEIAKAAIPAVQWVAETGIMTGMNDGTFSPKGELTRAQAATILMRFDVLLAEQLPLSLWTNGAVAKNELISYIETVTDEGGAYFIPVEDRIAVFDLDGTLFCETDPIYFDHMLFQYRVTEDPAHKDGVTDFEKTVAAGIQSYIDTGVYPEGMDNDHGQGVASAFAGMTLDEFDNYIQAFKQQPMPSYTGMNRGDAYYLPMVQVVQYLQENGFTVYVVSGTDRLIVRGLLKGGPLNLPNRQIIGSDEAIVSSSQGGKDGLDHVFVEGDKLVLGGEFVIKNLKMNKVAVIAQEIGQQPVLSFGNSTGDSSMAEYVTSGNRYKSLAFMLCCDDTARENGSVSKAEKMYSMCSEYGWVPISMKNDWTTIYGDGVTYLGSAAKAS